MATNPYADIENREPGRIGCAIHYMVEVSSTQDVARGLARDGAPEGTVVIAETQTAGRGRLGRQWHSPPGVNLYLTVILRPALSLAEVPRLSLVAGVAAAEALETVAPGLVQLKWPNDVWLGGRKAGGIIAEAVTHSDGRISCVLLGIGLNVNLGADEFPRELRQHATSVLVATGKPCARAAVARELLSRLDNRYRETENRGFEAVRALFEKYSALTARRVTVIDGQKRQSGVARGIDAEGALLLETDRGMRRIVGGDVTLEGAYD
jgi:BirA family transcriptional regulator, biotin operon repressor / biotin---[acetyl-CoA-carboxylase] ligase